MLQQRALKFSCMLSRHDFKASSRWLQRFKEGPCNAEDRLCNRVPENFDEYDAVDVYNADETALFSAPAQQNAGVKGQEVPSEKTVR